MVAVLHLTIVALAVTADSILANRPEWLPKDRLFWALSDTATHGVLAASSWLLVEVVQHTAGGGPDDSAVSPSLHRTYSANGAFAVYIGMASVVEAAWKARVSIIGAGIVGAMIDLDHFAAAKSFALSDATSL
eukprot:gene24728-28477_t